MIIQQRLAEITSIEVPPEIEAGKILPVRVRGTIGTPFEGHLSVALFEPPAYITYRSFTSTPMLAFSPPGFDIVMELGVQMDNVLGVNHLRVDVMSQGYAVASGRTEVTITKPIIPPPPPDFMGPIMGMVGIVMMGIMMWPMIKRLFKE